MAIYFYNHYSTKYGSRNFGDDINPFLLGSLFSKALIDSPQICIVGIGTILATGISEKVAHYERKIVFSSGVAYDRLTEDFDAGWDFVCVRGPKTRAVLNLPEDTGICDGAILLADFFPPRATSQREGIVFIPHVNTDWAAGEMLRRICRESRLAYLCPDAPAEHFIEMVRGASLVITEAMHGAILADAMRTPWIPMHFLNHTQFKWEDWFASVELPYASHHLHPPFWKDTKHGMRSFVKKPYHAIKHFLVKRRLQAFARLMPFMSTDGIIEARKMMLREKVQLINERYRKET